MKQLISKLILSVFAMTFAALASASAQDAAKPCISAADFEEIGKSFQQVADLVKPGKAEYCEADLTPQWYLLVRSLETLKNIKPNEPTETLEDAFTFKAINESNWWAYFTKRASTFALIEKCQDGVVAFVMPLFGQGEVNLCPLFFEQNITSQASVMMHEVRHFDGHSHVKCTRGADIGSSGACDTDILNKGSYAITAQTLVAMARAKELPAEEKPMVEAEAIFTMYNRFNVIPKTRVEHSLILSNTSGEVYKWGMEDNSMDLITTLPQAARVYVGYANNMTIYPVDTNSEAFRLDSTFKTSIPSIGLFAVEYNKLSADERTQIQSVAYLGAGGLLANNVVALTCGSGGLIKQDLAATGEFTRIISLSEDEVDSAYQSYAMNKAGELYSYKCKTGATDAIEIAKTEITVEPSLTSAQDMVGLGGKIFALEGSGKIAEVKNVNNQIVKVSPILSAKNKNWVSVTPISQVEVFK